MSAGTTAFRIAALRTTALLGFSTLLVLLAPGSATTSAQNRFSLKQLRRSAAPAAAPRQAAPRVAAAAPTAAHRNPFSVEQIQAARAARARAAAPESLRPAAPTVERADPRRAAGGRAAPRPGGSGSRRQPAGTEAATSATPAPETAVSAPLVVIATSWGDRSGRTLPRTPTTGKRQPAEQAPTGQAAGSATRKASPSPRDRQQQDEAEVHINIWDVAFWPRYRDASCRRSYWANPYGYRSLVEAPQRRRFRRS